MDKMFFLINAIDLAENEVQRKQREYVEEQLRKWDPKPASLFVVKPACPKGKDDSKSGCNCGINAFEQAFYQFISNDLTEMTILAAEKELTRVRELLTKLIQSSSDDMVVKEQKRTGIKRQKARYFLSF